MATKFYLGIDGGGTKTGMTLIDNTGTVLSTLRGPGSSIVGSPSDESVEVLQTLSRKLLDNAGISTGDITKCAIGMNGVDFQDEFDMQHRELSSCLGLSRDKVSLANDGIAALWGASGCERSAIFQLGTAFTSAYRKAYGEESLFDHLNTGKMYDIRMELAKTVSRMIDGRVERTPLFDKAMGAYGVEDESLFRELLYRNRIPWPFLRSTPPIIFQAWLEGDEPATVIIENAIEEYILAAQAMIRKIGAENSAMVFGGGVIINAPEKLWTILTERIKSEFPHVDIHPPILPPEHGAALWAAFTGGEDSGELFEKLREQYEQNQN